MTMAVRYGDASDQRWSHQRTSMQDQTVKDERADGLQDVSVAQEHRTINFNSGWLERTFSAAGQHYSSEARDPVLAAEAATACIMVTRMYTNEVVVLERFCFSSVRTPLAWGAKVRT